MFVCLLMDDKQISERIKTIQRNVNGIVDELKEGEIRNFINLNRINI